MQSNTDRGAVSSDTVGGEEGEGEEDGVEVIEVDLVPSKEGEDVVVVVVESEGREGEEEEEHMSNSEEGECDVSLIEELGVEVEDVVAEEEMKEDIEVESFSGGD